MSFARPLALIALIVVPMLIVLWRLQERRRAQQAAAFSSPALLPNLVGPAAPDCAARSRSGSFCSRSSR